VDLKLGSFNLPSLKIGNLYNTYLGMNSREQTIALVVAGVIAALVIIVPISLASNKISRLERDIGRGQKQVREIVREIDKYQDLRAELLGAEKKLAGGFDSSIATTMESLATKAGIGGHIDSLKEKPTAASDILDEVTVDVRLKKVGLKDLITYLHSIEQNPTKLLRLRTLDIKPRYDNKNELNTSFSVSTFRLLETSEGGE